MARAVLEGVAFSLKHCFDAAGISPTENVLITGGGARNHFWCDIIASVLNTPVKASEESDHGVWGAAVLGGLAAQKLNSGAASRSLSERVHKPKPDWVEQYIVQYQTYRQCLEATRPMWKSLSKEQKV